MRIMPINTGMYTNNPVLSKKKGFKENEQPQTQIQATTEVSFKGEEGLTKVLKGVVGVQAGGLLAIAGGLLGGPIGAIAGAALGGILGAKAVDKAGDKADYYNDENHSDAYDRDNWWP